MVRWRVIPGIPAIVLVGFVAWVAADLWIPIVAATLVALVLRPFVSQMEAWKIPAAVGALVVVGFATALLACVLYVLYGPASAAVQDLPRATERAAAQIRNVKHTWFRPGALGTTLEIIDEIQTAPIPSSARVALERPSFRERIVDMGLTFVLGGLAAMLLVYFFLVHSDTLFRRLVEVMPTLSDKKRIVDIVRSVRMDVSRYLLVVTTINALLGAVVAALLMAVGVENALFWGAFAGVMNFIPYVGPLLVAAMLLLVGFGSSDSSQPLASLVPAGVYLIANAVESNLVTPMALGRQFAINPVVILLWLMAWGWLWGVAGLLFGVPLLVTVKVLLERSESTAAWATLIDTRPPSPLHGPSP